MHDIIIKNNLNYDSPLAIGTQTWFNGRLRFLVAGNYGNNSGVNDTIYALPENFGALSELRSLYLEWNRISVLPPSFSDLSNLLSLYINNNILENLMDDIGNLTNLYFLDLGYNAISSNEAMAIIFSEAAKENFSALSFSFGSGMTNVALAYNGVIKNKTILKKCTITTIFKI